MLDRGHRESGGPEDFHPKDQLPETWLLWVVWVFMSGVDQVVERERETGDIKQPFRAMAR